MKTWNDYKQHVKDTDPLFNEDMVEIEALASIIGAMIERRNTMGMSQRELAALCNVPQSSVARIESYKTVPNLDTLLKLLRPLGLTLTISSLN